MKLAYSLALIASLVLINGCAHYRQSAAHHSTRYYGMVDPDQTLERRVRADLNSNPDLAAVAPNILISAQNGTVTLSGSVPSEKARQQVDAIVRNTSGVAVVNDQLLPPYSPTGDYGRPARIYASPPDREPRRGDISELHRDVVIVQAATDSDRQMARRVAQQLRSAPLPPGSLDSVGITVYGPIVHVEGSVASEQQRQAIMSALEKTEGISAVEERLQVP